MGVHGEFLRRHGRLIKSTTVLPPAIRFETHTSGFRRCDRSFSFQSRMTAIPIVVVSKCEELRSPNPEQSKTAFDPNILCGLFRSVSPRTDATRECMAPS